MSFCRTLLAMACLGIGLTGCDNSPSNQDEAAAWVKEIDMLQLPTANWALSNSIIQLSFCRDRVNQALQADAEDLNRWRLVGELSAFPEDRAEGLEQLAELYRQHDVLLYQLSGNFGGQVYRVAYRPNRPEPNIINVFAKVGRDRHICYSSLDANER